MPTHRGYVDILRVESKGGTPAVWFVLSETSQVMDRYNYGDADNPVRINLPHDRLAVPLDRNLAAALVMVGFLQHALQERLHLIVHYEEGEGWYQGYGVVDSVRIVGPGGAFTQQAEDRLDNG